MMRTTLTNETHTLQFTLLDSDLSYSKVTVKLGVDYCLVAALEPILQYFSHSRLPNLLPVLVVQTTLAINSGHPWDYTKWQE